MSKIIVIVLCTPTELFAVAAVADIVDKLSGSYLKHDDRLGG